MVLTRRTPQGTGDLHPFVQRAMGIGAAQPIKDPVVTMSISVHRLTFTIQVDGHIAIFDPDRLIGCECQGAAVFSMPDTAKLIVGFTYNVTHIFIFQDGPQFYSVRGERVTALKIYSGPRNPEDDDRNMVEQNDANECVLWHSNSDDLDDYYKVQEDAGDHSPIPRHGQDDQVRNDPKEGR